MDNFNSARKPVQVSESSRRDVAKMAPAYDHYDPRPSKQKFLIVSQPRTGSTLLALLLKSNDLGNPVEFFNPRYVDAYCSTRALSNLDKTMYFDHLLDNRKTEDGIFGMKTHIGDLFFFLTDGGYENMFERTVAFIEKFDAVIYINRRNKLAQAVSNWRGLQSDDWTSFEATSDSNELPVLSEDDLHQILQFFPIYQKHDMQMQKLFKLTKVRKLQLWYEDMIADKEGTVKSLAELFEKPDLKWQEVTKVMRNNVNEDLEFQILNRLLGDIDPDKIFPLLDR